MKSFGLDNRNNKICPNMPWAYICLKGFFVADFWGGVEGGGGGSYFQWGLVLEGTLCFKLGVTVYYSYP